MALAVGQNSWVTIIEADTYLEHRIGSVEWFSLSDTGASGTDTKENMLVSAFYWLTGSPDLLLTPTLTDPNVKNAQIEAALFLLEHYTELNERRAAINTGVSDFEYSKRSETFNYEQLKIPPQIMGLLSNYSYNHAFVDLCGEYDV